MFMRRRAIISVTRLKIKITRGTYSTILKTISAQIKSTALFFN
jgi:hypothetical protein